MRHVSGESEGEIKKGYPQSYAQRKKRKRFKIKNHGVVFSRKINPFPGKAFRRACRAFRLRGTIFKRIVRTRSTLKAIWQASRIVRTFKHLLIDAASPIRSPNPYTCTLFMEPSEFLRCALRIVHLALGNFVS